MTPLEEVLALINADDIVGADARMDAWNLKQGLSGHDQQIAQRAITKTKARLAAKKAVAEEVAREADEAARKQKKGKKGKKGKKPPKG